MPVAGSSRTPVREVSPCRQPPRARSAARIIISSRRASAIKLPILAAGRGRGSPGGGFPMHLRGWSLRRPQAHPAVAPSCRLARAWQRWGELTLTFGEPTWQAEEGNRRQASRLHVLSKRCVLPTGVAFIGYHGSCKSSSCLAAGPAMPQSPSALLCSALLCSALLCSPLQVWQGG
jgi:hypothetical protein